MSRLLGSLLALAALGPLAPTASANLYRWVDERGVVNYGDTPPANARQVRPLSPEQSSVSVVPGLSREDVDRAKKTTEQARIERLEREVKALREEARNTPPPTPPLASESANVYIPVYGGPLRPPRPWPPKPPKPEPIEPLPPPPPPLYTRPR